MLLLQDWLLHHDVELQQSKMRTFHIFSPQVAAFLFGGIHGGTQPKQRDRVKVNEKTYIFAACWFWIECSLTDETNV